MPRYEPIACHLHDTYEIAIMGQRRLQLRWRDGDSEHSESVLPLDLRTADSAEWLLARDDHGEQLLIRLDWISDARPM